MASRRARATSSAKLATVHGLVETGEHLGADEGRGEELAPGCGLDPVLGEVDEDPRVDDEPGHPPPPAGSTTMRITQWFFPLGRYQVNPARSKRPRVPLYRNDAEVRFPGVSCG